MSNSTGSEYYLKSMNGIKSFDDGSGTVIEDDTITCTTINCQTFSADYLNALNNITGLNVVAEDTVYSLNIQTDNITAENEVVLKGTTQVSDLIINNTCKVAQIIPPSFISDVRFWKDMTIPIYFGKFIFSNYDILASDITQPVNLFTNGTSTLTIGQGSLTAITIGHMVFNANSIQTTDPSSNLSIFTDSTAPRISVGKYRLQGYSFGPNLNTNCTLYTFLTSGGLTFGPSKGLLTMPTTNIISLGPDIKIQTTSLYSNAVDSVINLFNNITTGTINLGNSLTSTGTLNMGGVGNVKVGNVFTFKSENIISSGINDTINLFNNITTGTINFCNSLTTGILQIRGRFRHATTNVIGYSRFLEIASTNTIPTPIDIQYYVYVRGTQSTSLTLPSYIEGQLITIRNAKLNGNAILTVQCPGNQYVITGPGVQNNSFTMSYYSCYTLFCDGSKWIIMDKS